MLTLDERERLAYIGNDRASLSLISQTEDEAYNAVTPEHEAVIDDRNRLRDALQTLVDEAEDLGEVIANDEPIGEAAPRSFRDAIASAEAALEQCDAQIDDTLADKLRKAETERDDYRRRLDDATRELSKSRQLADSVRSGLRTFGRQGFSAKPAPKWAQHLIAALARLEKP